MRYHNITKDDMLNGDGLRVVLWLAGCNHFCRNCQNPQTWDEKGGLLFDESALAEIYDQMKKPYISGITLSGGDPLFPKNRKEITELIESLKSEYPDKTVWCYTGYNWKEVKHLTIMKFIDVLVDGEFVQELAEVNCHWAGSTNQRIINVQESLKSKNVILWK